MSEGLNPIEAGKKLHEHTGKQHEHDGERHENGEQGDGHGGDGGDGGRHSRIVQVVEVVLLSIVTLTAAWAGYSAARWSTDSRVEIAESSTLRNLATRADLEANTLRNFDASTFNAWFIAFTLNNPHAPPGPTYMPQYKLPAQAQANKLDNEAAAKFNAGNQAGTTSDNFVQITVFLAAVLFLVGIGSSFKLYGVRYALISFGAALLIISLVLIAQQPGLPS